MNLANVHNSYFTIIGVKSDSICKSKFNFYLLRQFYYFDITCIGKIDKIQPLVVFILIKVCWICSSQTI